MSRPTESKEDLTAKARRLYRANEIPMEWNEIVNLIDVDHEIFAASLRRADRYKDKLPLDAPRSHILWISYNLASGFMGHPDCYFCGKVIKREEFLDGKVDLDHFNPLVNGGEHTPINGSPVCSSCNRLKNRYYEKDFDLLLNSPEEFWAKHPKMTPKTYQRLLDFAELIGIRLKGNNWIVERFGATGQPIRQICDELRLVYRRKWGID